MLVGERLLAPFLDHDHPVPGDLSHPTHTACLQEAAPVHNVSLAQ